MRRLARTHPHMHVQSGHSEWGIWEGLWGTHKAKKKEEYGVPWHSHVAQAMPVSHRRRKCSIGAHTPATQQATEKKTHAKSTKKPATYSYSLFIMPQQKRQQGQGSNAARAKIERIKNTLMNYTVTPTHTEMKEEWRLVWKCLKVKTDVKCCMKKNEGKARRRKEKRRRSCEA